MLVRLMLVAVLVVPLAIAAEPAATVFTGGPLTINGVQVTTAGVPSVPVAAGDEIATTTESAVIVFADGSRVTMNKQTRAKLTTGGPRGINLLAGSAAFKSASSSHFDLRALGRPVDVKSVSEGTVSITGRDQYTFKAKGPGDNNGNGSNGKYKKPKPRSNHGRGDDEP